MKLNLGCGNKRKDGYTNVDKALSNADLFLDLEGPFWPWDENFIDEIVAEHLVEHLLSFSLFMNRCNKVLVSGGSLTIITPHPMCDFFWQDPTHIRGYTENTFTLYCTGYPGTEHSGIVPWGWTKVSTENSIINGVQARIITAVLFKK